MSIEQVILFAVKLVFAGASGAAAMIFWSKTKDIAWTFIISGFIFRYIGFVYELFETLNIISFEKFIIAQVPLVSLVFSIIPDCLFLSGFALLINRKN